MKTASNGIVTPNKDKLIEVEKSETGSVKLSVLFHYFSYF